MHRTIATTAALLAASAYAQQAGTNTAEVHPKLTTQKCTGSGSCTDSQNSIVLDSNWRWVHNVGGSTNCYTGNTWDAALCPDAETCATNCALDGADYSGTYGITTSGGSLKLDFKTGSNVGSRVYLLDTTDAAYEEFTLLNQEFTFDVDVSTLPCGINGALYFVSMDADGGTSEYSTNKAGAKYGTGYCDSQCPQDIKFIDGEVRHCDELSVQTYLTRVQANVAGWTPSNGDANSGTGNWGSCCSEMDIWEANSISAAFTPHPCSITGQARCDNATSCGSGDDRYNGLCDKDGCDFNSYRMGNHTFYGPGNTVDTSSIFTVVTQFITDTGTSSGKLSEIRRIYVQDGKVIQNSKVDITGIPADNSISTEFCTAEKEVTGDTNSFQARGGLTKMGQDLEAGMVLVMSIWDDYAADMLWLDSTYPVGANASTPGAVRGTCATDSGIPATVESQSSGASVTFSNIKFGDLNSTYAAS